MAKTIADNLQTIIDIKQNIKTAIKNKGVEVADSDSFTTYADKIESIETGGGDTTNYSYLVNTVDEAGLRAIGWSDESIGYFKDNTLHYQWENSDYVVSEENKVLYGKINKNNIGTYVDNPNVIFMPMFDINGIPTYVNALRDFKHIKGVPILDLANATVINYFFSSCSALITIPLLNTSNVNSMNSMFSNCTKLESIPQLNTSKVTDMRNMFHYCTSLATIPLLNTSKVTNMQSMFNGCTNLKTIPPLNTSKVTHMSYMFNGCSNLTTIPQLDTSNVTNMNYMFSNCSKLESIPLLDTSKATNMEYMFNYCSSLITIPAINTSNVTNMYSIFNSCSKLTTIPQLDTSNVTNMNYMFSSCTKLESLPLLDCSSVTSIGTFFGYSNITTLTELGGFKNLKINWTDSGSLYLLPNLTYQSVMNVINNLYDFRGNGDTTTTRTIKFNANSKALLSDEDIAVATNKGWIIS